MKHLFTLIITLFYLSLQGQVSFYNANDRLSNSDFHSGVAIGIADMNNDGLDDIIRLSEGRFLNIEMQQAGSQQFQNISVEQVSNQSQWSLCVADVNNDGYNEVLSGGAYDNIKIVQAMDNGSSYQMSILPESDMFIQGSNLVDINNDGYIDFFACHDDAESRIWSNDGNGNLVPANEWIDMATVPVSDNSGNYGSIWTDFDHDGDIDLYIAKCRQGVNDSSDPRRINALYVNDGNGNFSEQAAAANLKIGAQSWTADFQDIDNDGDYDCFITNHDLPSMLLENDGSGVFTDITEGSGIDIGGLPIQGVMRDFDNDGYVDILVAGSEHFLFRNNGDKTFTEVEGLFDENDMESFAIGDLNHDGFLDIYGGYANIYTNPSNIEDVIWMNNGNEEHQFLAVRLVGQQSNRNGIGARIEIYGEWGIQVREVRAGESYGIMNSMTQHFGLGTADLVDSLIVRWPSGQVDQYQNIEAEQFVTLLEGNCISPEATVSVEGELLICEGDSVLITANEPGLNYLWSTGDTTQSIWAVSAGGYSVEVSSGEGCSSNSPVVEIVANPDQTPEITATGDLQFCRGGEVILNASTANSYLWSNGDITPSILVEESGTYTVTIQGICEAFTSEPVTVTVLDSEAPELIDYQEGQDFIEAMVSGSNVYWYESEEAVQPFATGNTVSIPVVDATAVAYVENQEVYMGESFEAGMEEHQGSEYSGNQYNGSIIFDCFEPFTLQQVTVYTDTEGPRDIQLRDVNNNVLQSKVVNIPMGVSTITLDFEVAPGTNLSLTTDGGMNQETFGFPSPRLQRSSLGVAYPYVVEGVLQINTANLGNDRYYYFYNWKVQKQDNICISDRQELTFFILDAEDQQVHTTPLRLYPNPAAQSVMVELPESRLQDYQLRLLNAQGQAVQEQQLKAVSNQYQLSLSGLAPGLYVVVLENVQGVYTGRIIKE